MNRPSPPSCEDCQLEVLVEGPQGARNSREHLASCSRCRRQLDHFQRQVDAGREFLAPSGLQMQRIRAKVWEKIEAESRRDPWWQPVWAMMVLVGFFVLLTLATPYVLPPVARLDLGEASLYASAADLEGMADQLLPETEAAVPAWEQALSGGIMEAESMEQIDDMLEFIVPDRGEQT